MSACENPNVDKDVLMKRRQKFDGKTKICVKCKENTGNIVIRYAVYCKTCFFPLIQTRFRKSLEPLINVIPDGPRRKGLQAAGSLVIAFSGGTGSTALLDLVAKTYFASRATEDDNARGGKEHPRNKEKGIWKGKPLVCFVEVCGAFSGEKNRVDDVRAIVESYAGCPFDFVPLRLEDAFDSTWWADVNGGDLATSARSLGLDMSDEDLRINQGSLEGSPLNALRTYLSSLPTQTAFHTAIQILTRVLLLNTAAARGASHLLLGTSLTSLSVNLISGIAQGGGFSVSEEVMEEWRPRRDRGETIRVVRPMRDIGMKECAIWDWWYGLHLVGGSGNKSQGGKNAIYSLTRDFIFGLESDYPATVSTIARTCAKLIPKEGSDGICVLCERPAQHGVQAWKSQISIRSYQEASSAMSGSTRPSHLTEDEIANLTTKNSHSISNSTTYLTPQLCYACHTTLTSRSSRGTTVSLPSGKSLDSVPVPYWVRGAMHPYLVNRDKMSRSDMEAHISDFLLADE